MIKTKSVFWTLNILTEYLYYPLLITFLKLLSTIYLPIYFYISLLVMGVPHQKIYFGNWMLYSLLSETFTGNFLSNTYSGLHNSPPFADFST